MQSRAISLIETVVAIAILGIISAVGSPMITNFTDSATKGRSQSNAQRLAHTDSVVLIAGHDFVGSEAAIEGVVQRVVTGATLILSNLDEPVFVGIPTIPAALQSESIAFL